MGTIINHVPNMFYVEFHQDYVLLCQSCAKRKSEKSKSSPHCKAFILAVMEKWTNDKFKKGKDLFVTMTIPQWIEEMYGMFGRNVIIDSLDELASEELIEREKYRILGRDSYRYKLKVEEVNKRMAELPSLLVTATSLKVTGSDGKVIGSSLQKDGALSLDAFKSNPFIEEESTKNQTKNRTKEETNEQASFSSIIFSLEEERVLEWGRKLKVIIPKDRAKVKQYCADIALEVQTYEQFLSLHAVAEKRLPSDSDGIVKLGNMANAQTLTIWKKEQELVADEWWDQSKRSEEPERIDEPVTESPEEEALSAYVPEWQPEQKAIKPDFFIKGIMERVCCASGARDHVAKYRKEANQIYQDSEMDREDFEKLLKRVEEASKGREMEYFMCRLHKLAGVKAPNEPIQVPQVEPLMMEVAV